MMKISAFLIFIFSLQLFAANSYSQSARLTLHLNNTKIKDVLMQIENQSEFYFLYNGKLVDVDRTVSVNVNNQQVTDVLGQLFPNKDVAIKVVDRQIVLLPSSMQTDFNDAIAAQQGISITGTITDEKGESMPGVSIKIKGTSVGSVTDVNGKFVINAPSQDAVLVFSFIGYATQEIIVGNQRNINITLQEDTRQIEEVVVVGYGTQKKVNLTGAVASVSGDELTKRPVSNPVTMLQGQIPGLSIVQGTGQPGNEGAMLRIRGQGTYSSAGSDPLILIDGVPGNLTNLNANDIETISVLKDASSASIYGARAANGVILVTTKSGEENKFKVSYDLNLGINTATRMLDLVTNSADYMRMFNEAKVNSGIASSSTTYTDEMISLYEKATDRAKYPNFDWLDYAFDPALVQNHNLSLSGGTRGTTYNVGLGYVYQPGTMKGYKFEKYTFRTNLRSQLKDWITVGTNLALERGNVYSTAQGQADAFLSFLSQAPTYGPKLPDGSGYVSKAYSFESNNKNMGAIVDNDVMKNTIGYDASAQLWLEVKLFKGLTWYTKGAVNFLDNSSKDWHPVVPLYNYQTGAFTGNLDVGTTGLTAINDRTFYTNLFSYLKYDTTIAEDHNLGLQFGYSQETNRYDNLQGYRKTFLANLHELDAGTTDLQTNRGYAYQWALQSFFGRLNYDYKGRYLFEVNARYDATSRMSKDNRWGLFPSFSAGWRVSEEEFIKNWGASWLDNLKIRGSYGLLGNQNISVGSQPYPYQSFLSYTGNYPFDNSTLSTGVAQTSFANKDIKWESTSVFDIGFDLTVFRGLSITYDYYKRNTTDILRNAQVSALLGLDAPIVNSGAMVNFGHEISIQYNDRVDKGMFEGLVYGAGVYFNKNKNEARNFGVDEISGYYLRRNGIPYNSYYVLECIGVFQTQDEIDKSPKQFSDNVKPGDLKYRDVNDDKVVNNDDRVVVNGAIPKYEYSFNLYANWKGFDLSAFFQGIKGRKYFVNGWGYTPFRQGTPPTKEWLTDRWTGPGTSNWLPRTTFDYSNDSQNRRNSTWFLQNASYLRLKNLTFGYSLPKKIISHIRCEKVRVYFSGDNLLLGTKYKDLDPERPGDGNFAQYPQNRIVSFGLNVEF